MRCHYYLYLCDNMRRCQRAEDMAHKTLSDNGKFVGSSNNLVRQVTLMLFIFLQNNLVTEMVSTLEVPSLVNWLPYIRTPFRDRMVYISHIYSAP